MPTPTAWPAERRPRSVSTAPHDCSPRLLAGPRDSRRQGRGPPASVGPTSRARPPRAPRRPARPRAPPLTLVSRADPTDRNQTGQFPAPRVTASQARMTYHGSQRREPRKVGQRVTGSRGKSAEGSHRGADHALSRCPRPLRTRLSHAGQQFAPIPGLRLSLASNVALQYHEGTRRSPSLPRDRRLHSGSADRSRPIPRSMWGQPRTPCARKRPGCLLRK
jgi:hypothetical protein